MPPASAPQSSGSTRGLQKGGRSWAAAVGQELPLTKVSNGATRICIGTATPHSSTVMLNVRIHQTRIRRPLHLRAMVLSLAVLLTSPAKSNKSPSYEPVKHIGVYVTPFYAAAATREGTPRVSVAREFDALLASNQVTDIIAVRDAVQAQPKQVSPTVLMVLAIRLYDLGLRDDSVFWFYVAKNRFFTMDDVLDLRTAGLVGMAVAVTDFAKLAGLAINSYAFCNPDRQAAAARRAVEWVEAHPYDLLFSQRLAARPGDRAENLRQSLARLHEVTEQERQFFTDPKNREELEAQRRRNRVPEQFC